MIVSNTLPVLDARAPKDVKCRSERQIHLALAQFVHQLKISNALGPTSIRTGNRGPLAQSLDQLTINALHATRGVRISRVAGTLCSRVRSAAHRWRAHLTEALHIGSMHEKLGAEGCQPGKRFLSQLKVRRGLPAIDGDKPAVPVRSTAAAQIEHNPFPPN